MTGTVELTFVEIFDRGTMLVMNKPTVGITEDGSKRMLTSGGEFLVKVTQNGVELKTNCAYRISVPTSLTSGTDPEMTSFKGNIDDQGELTWEYLLLNQNEFWIGAIEGTGGELYSALVPYLGWFNCDRFAYDSNNSSTVTYTTPNGYNNSNSQIYIVDPSFPNALSIAISEMPIGQKLYFILVSESNGGFQYAITPLVTIGANQNVDFSLSEMKIGTTEQLVNAINNLK